MLGTISIARRFMGPEGTANGGYTCGVIASFARGSVTVRLSKPVPLDTPLRVEQRDDGLEVLHEGVPVAAARPGEIGDLVPPRPPTLDEAARASSRYAGFSRHPAPECFVCGPLRAEGDALRVFAGPTDQAGVAAAPWTPDPSLEDQDGSVAAPFVWAALDCPGFAAAAPDMRPMLLGELTVRIDRAVRVGEPHVVVGWVIRASGRKHEAATALFDARGGLHAVGRAIWIEPRERGGLGSPA